MQRRSCNAPVTLLDAPGRCFCCCRSHKALLQHSWTLFLLLQEPQSAPAALPDAVPGCCRTLLLLLQSHRALLQRSWMLFLLLEEPQGVPATLPDAVSAAAEAPRRCFCFCRTTGHKTLLRRSQTLLVAAGATKRSSDAPGRCFCCCRSHRALAGEKA